ncbi:hypothetical protein CONLIGDRAFT_685841 [Coniochaeta ligniaria NRRL 30616]|uniref:Uncharacterized protein n=1 Tax=Coniochaeta ligniaria NRRL 30616 TaxID=1408157 RepID=A0A1J7I9T1_9PEZI|nr:hypothetical protein CONLIGDRAFT_685841 [Coniochaeta ligniaria NRRL 30616]
MHTVRLCCIKSTVNAPRRRGGPTQHRPPRRLFGLENPRRRPQDVGSRLETERTPGPRPDLAGGHLNRPEDISRVFWQNLHGAGQFGLDSDSRFYRTGGLGRLNPDGSTRFMRRKDCQVKVYGRRIRLGEIDYHLRDTLPTGVKVVAGAEHRRAGSLTLVENQVHVQVHTLRALAVEQLSQNAAELQGRKTSSEKTSPRPTATNTHDTKSLAHERMTAQERSRVVSHRAATAADALCPLSWFPGVPTSTEPFVHKGRRPDGACADKPHKYIFIGVNLLRQVSGVSDNFFDLDGDSPVDIQLAAFCQTHHVLLTIDDIVRHPTILSQVESVRAGLQRVLLATWESSGHNAWLPSHVDDGDPLQEEVAGTCHVRSDAAEDIYPASAVQESLMALSMDKSPTMSQIVFRTPDDIDKDSLRIVWQRAVGNTTIFRTRIDHLPDVVFNVRVLDDGTVQSFLSQLKDLSAEVRNITNLCSLFVLPRAPNERTWVPGLERITDSPHNDFRYLLVVECILETAEKLTVAFPCLLAILTSSFLRTWHWVDSREAVPKSSKGRGGAVTVDDDAAPARGKRGRKAGRKLIWASQRKYNPADPRIITLDSLGASHSPVYSHLKQYLIAEFRDKQNKDIDYEKEKPTIRHVTDPG